MTISGQPDIEQLVAASLLRLGTDTRGPRLFKQLALAARPPRDIPGLLAAAIETRPAERARQLQRARDEAGAALNRAHPAGIVPIRTEPRTIQSC